MQNIGAEIISIGTEILLGEITDTNSVYIARRMRDIGINIFHMVSVGDNERRITETIKLALGRADVVITTGGLGPTVDDMTRQAVAQATGRELLFHQDLLDSIAARFAGFRSNMTANNRRQAFLPEDSILIENPVGTAPCFVVEYEGSVVISLPGVPREMKYLLDEQVIPFLKERYTLGIIKALNLRAAGIGESTLDDMIGSEILENVNPTVGLAAHSGVIDVRVTAKAEDEAAADVMIEDMAQRLRARIGSYIFGTDEHTIEAALVEQLRGLHGTLAISETGAGDYISRRVQSVPDSSTVLVQSEQFANAADLGKPALGLQALAQEVAQRICDKSGSLVGIAVISDPERMADQADSDIGTAVAVVANGQSASRVYGFGSQSAEARLWPGTWALSRAWRMLAVSEA